MEHPETLHQDVRAVVSVDERGVMAVDGRRPYELRDFGQDAAIASLLRYATVVVGASSAQSYGGRPPGACVIVLTSPSSALPLANVWKGAIVVHSVQEVLRVSRGAPLYVLGGARIHALFAPHVRTVYRFVYEGASLDARGSPVVLPAGGPHFTRAADGDDSAQCELRVD